MRWPLCSPLSTSTRDACQTPASRDANHRQCSRYKSGDNLPLDNGSLYPIYLTNRLSIVNWRRASRKEHGTMNTDSVPSKAVKIAIQHVEAFSTHEYDTARSLLAEDVHFLLITSIPGFPNPVEGHGVEAFMKALTSGNTLIPGSLQVIHSIGDDQQALLTVSVNGTLPTQEPITLLAARHYMIDENEKIKNELVILTNYEGKV